MPSDTHTPQLVEKAESCIRHNDLLPQDEPVVVALSGGPDSVALLLALHELGLREERDVDLVAAHLNHCLRGDESDAEQRFCRDLAAELELTFYTDEIDVRQAAEEDWRSLEDAARRCRYRFLADAADRAGASRIATGHHRDDLAETVLMRLIRGCGVRGLAAFSPRDPIPIQRSHLEVVRPLFECRGREILAFLRWRQQNYCTDSSNEDSHFLRNRIRHELLPHLRENYRQFSVDSLAALATSAGEMTEMVDRALDTAWNGLCVERSGDELSLDADALLQMATALRKEAIRRATAAVSDSPGPVDIKAHHLEAAHSVLTGPVGRQTSLPRGVTVRREHGALHFSGQSDTGATLPAREISIGEPLQLPEADVTLHSEVLEGDDAEDLCPDTMQKRDHAYLALEHLSSPLTVRGRRRGDRFYPLGAPGHRKLKELLIDRKIPRHRRDSLPLVVDDDGRIAWVAGIEIAHPFRLRGAEERILHLWLERTREAR
ncbi:MAG: tRNA lysidine(34) synthetase TilS [Planctomycetota bacterium]